MKRSTLLVTIAAGVAAVAAMAWAFAPRPLEVEVAAVTQGVFEATIDEDAKTRLRDRYLVSAPLAGLLRRVTLREGDAVAADAVVALLTPLMPAMVDDRTLREQQIQVEVADARVDQAGARIERAKVTLAQANDALQRSQQLSGQGFVSPAKLETDRLAVAAAQKELEAAQQDRHVAGHQVDEARAALAAVRSPTRTGGRVFELRAPVAGRVLRLQQTSEGVVALGTPVMEVGDTRKLEVVAELLTTDALRATPGRRVIIERWGGPGVLEGRVRLVEPAAFTKVSALGVEEQRVRVLIDIETPPETWAALGDAYRVGVRIVTVSVPDAIKVPTSAVFPRARSDGGKDGEMAVFVIDDGRARHVNVTLGARNGQEAWIREGLAPGATVIVYPPTVLKDGARVKSRRV